MPVCSIISIILGISDDDLQNSAAPTTLLWIFLQVNLIFISIHIIGVKSVFPLVNYMCDGHNSNLVSLTHYPLVGKHISMFIHQHVRSSLYGLIIDISQRLNVFCLFLKCNLSRNITYEFRG